MLNLRLDKVDLGIIEILRKDGRKPFTEVARKLGISDATVHIRLKKMIDAQVIKGFTIEVSEATLGWVTGFMLLNVKPSTVEEVSRQLAEIEGVSEVYEVHASDDLIMKITAKSLDMLRTVILKVGAIPNVVASQCLTVFKMWKGG